MPSSHDEQRGSAWLGGARRNRLEEEHEAERGRGCCLLPPLPPPRLPLLWGSSAAPTTASSRLLRCRKVEEGRASMPASDMSTLWSHTGQCSWRESPGLLCPSRHCLQNAWRQGKTCNLRGAELLPPPLLLPLLEACEEEDDELDEEIGAEDTHISLHSGHSWKSDSGNEAIYMGIRSVAQRSGSGVQHAPGRPGRGAAAAPGLSSPAHSPPLQPCLH